MCFLTVRKTHSKQQLSVIRHILQNAATFSGSFAEDLSLSQGWKHGIKR